MENDLIQIYQILKQQEETLLELHRGARAILESLRTPEFLEVYQKHYSAIGSSEVALGYAGRIRLIDETIQRLRDRQGC